jgi:ADP-heptose:LPS heptosyltransferase
MKILIIRRDNIGDLVCTTPAIRAVREQFPEARIGLLVNTYNADTVTNNPDIDEVFVYEKAKHAPEKNRLAVWLDNLRVLLRIRRERYDIAIGCGSYSPRLARYTRYTGARKRIGYVPRAARQSYGYTTPVVEPERPVHEVEKTFHLFSVLGITAPVPKMRVFPLEEEVQKAADFLESSGIARERPLVAFHISSRRPENRWPVERFIELAQMIRNGGRAEILLLWSPGSEKNVYHPGDDEKADSIVRSLEPRPAAYPTNTLRELIAALSISNVVVCGDGGAMHIAAGLGKRVVTIWGSTDPVRWRPWGVDHVLLQDESGRAENINAEKVFAALEMMLPEERGGK